MSSESDRGAQQGLPFRSLNPEVNSAVDHRQQQFFLKVWNEGSVLLHRRFGPPSVH